jgi:uncharacterized iron-regulated membrane protein
LSYTEGMSERDRSVPHEMTAWQRWVQHPQNTLLYKTFFQIHFVVGAVIGIGATLLTVLCFTGAIIWWPGIRNWHRSLTVNWRANAGRLSWDLHSALGFWCYIFIFIWAISGIYFAFSQPFNAFFHYIDPQDKFSDPVLAALSDLHFGRFNLITKVERYWIGARGSVSYGRICVLPTDNV